MSFKLGPGTTFLLWVLLILMHCTPPRNHECEALKKEIDRSYELDINKKTRRGMLMKYDELDCDRLPSK
jgi:hypothetical protein